MGFYKPVIYSLLNYLMIFGFGKNDVIDGAYNDLVEVLSKK